MSETQPLTVWRLEMPQKHGHHLEWLGPYTSHWLTARAEEIVRFMEAEHTLTHPEPRDRRVFAQYREIGESLLCGCVSEAALRNWFGGYLTPLLDEGGHLTRYQVPRAAVIDEDRSQVIFVQSRARLLGREGVMPAGVELIRSSAGSRAAIMTASNGKYDYVSAGPSRPLA